MTTAEMAAEMMTSAGRVGELAAAHADESNAARRLAQPIVDAVEASGINALAAPSALGGLAAHPSLTCDVIERISAFDASAGWCVGIGLGSNYLAGIIPEPTARKLFANVTLGGAGPFAPGAPANPDGDLVHVAGRWTYTSNCQHAAVSGCGVIIMEDGAPKVTAAGIEMGLAFLARDEFVIHETWNTEGLRATGSHDITADVRIEPERISNLFVDKWPDDAIFRLRTFDVLGPCLAAVPLGIGRAALDLVGERAVREAAGPPKLGPKPRLADNPWHQVELGRAEVRLRAARALLHEAMDDAHEHGVRGDVPPRETTAVIGLACSEALAAAKHAVEVATTLVGTDAVREGSPLLRLRRDIDAAGSHVMFSPMITSGLGRELAGVPTGAYPFVAAPAS